MFTYIIRKLAVAFVISILAVSYYLFKNKHLSLFDNQSMNQEREELIASLKKQYSHISMEEVTNRANEKLIAMANISALTADAAKLKQNPEAYGRAIAAYEESARLVSEIDQMMMLRYTFFKGKALYEFAILFPDHAESAEKVQTGIAVIEDVMKKWDREKDFASWNEMQNILNEYRKHPLNPKAVQQS